MRSDKGFRLAAGPSLVSYDAFDEECEEAVVEDDEMRSQQAVEVVIRGGVCGAQLTVISSASRASHLQQQWHVNAKLSPHFLHPA